MDSWSVVVALGNEVGDGERIGRDERLLALAARMDCTGDDPTSLAGFTSESLMREAAWRFLDMGRRLERALNTALVIGQALAVVRADESHESPLLEALLDIADSAMTYRRRYRATLQCAAGHRPARRTRATHARSCSSSPPSTRTSPRCPAFPTLARRSAEEQSPFEARLRVPRLDVYVVCAVEGDARPRCATSAPPSSPTCSASPTPSPAATSPPPPSPAPSPPRVSHELPLPPLPTGRGSG